MAKSKKHLIELLHMIEDQDRLSLLSKNHAGPAPGLHGQRVIFITDLIAHRRPPHRTGFVPGTAGKVLR